MKKHKLNNVAYDIIPDNPEMLLEKVNKYSNTADLIIVSGGTKIKKKVLCLIK